MSHSTGSFPSSSNTADAGEAPSSSSKPASATAESVSREGTGSTSSEWTPAPLARRSTHNYEHDSAQFSGGQRQQGDGGDEQQQQQQQPALHHNRRESFNREDQKQVGYAHLMQLAERNTKGFSEA